MKEIFVLNDIPVLIEIPNVVIGDTPEIVQRQPEPARVIPIIKTPRREPVVDPEFSIYAVSLPKTFIIISRRLFDTLGYPAPVLAALEQSDVHHPRSTSFPSLRGYRPHSAESRQRARQ